MRYLRRIVLAITLCVSLSSVAALQASKPVNQFWAGISYIHARRGGSAGQGALLSVVGVWHSSQMGALIGLAFGGPAGFIAGLAYGL